MLNISPAIGWKYMKLVFEYVFLNLFNWPLMRSHLFLALVIGMMASHSTYSLATLRATLPLFLCTVGVLQFYFYFPYYRPFLWFVFVCFVTLTVLFLFLDAFIACVNNLKSRFSLVIPWQNRSWDHRKKSLWRENVIWKNVVSRVLNKKKYSHEKRDFRKKT